MDSEEPCSNGSILILRVNIHNSNTKLTGTALFALPNLTKTTVAGLQVTTTAKIRSPHEVELQRWDYTSLVILIIISTT
jgi:hypothetical protein